MTTSISTPSTGKAHRYVNFSRRMCKPGSRPIMNELREDLRMHRDHFSGLSPNSFAISPLVNLLIASPKVIEAGVRL